MVLVMPELTHLADLIANLDDQGLIQDQLDQIYSVFRQHFEIDGVLVDGSRLKIYLKKSNISQFRNKPETFVHIVTRDAKGSGYRSFDKARANKIHWIKPILVNCIDSRIHVFDRSHDKTGKPQRYFWFKNKDFVVILRNYHQDNFLVTAFCVDPMTARKYQKWHQQGACNKKPHIMCGARSLGTATE